MLKKCWLLKASLKRRKVEEKCLKSGRLFVNQENGVFRFLFMCVKSDPLILIGLLDGERSDVYAVFNNVRKGWCVWIGVQRCVFGHVFDSV